MNTEADLGADAARARGFLLEEQVRQALRLVDDRVRVVRWCAVAAGVALAVAVVLGSLAGGFYREEDEGPFVIGTVLLLAVLVLCYAKLRRLSRTRHAFIDAMERSRREVLEQPRLVDTVLAPVHKVADRLGQGRAGMVSDVFCIALLTLGVLLLISALIP